MNIKQANVTVIIPCYRCSNVIGRAVESVMSQTVIPKEIILIDDYSQDNTLQTLLDLQDLYGQRIKVIHNDSNRGVAYTRNIGWDLATQPFIAFLDSDDAWHINKIEIQYFYMSENKDILMCTHGYRTLSPLQLGFDWDSRNLGIYEIKKSSLLLKNRFITPSVMIKTSCYLRFNENMRYMEDRLLWLEIICSKNRIVNISMDLAATYKKSYGDSGLSSHIFSMGVADLQSYLIIYKKNFINIFELFFYAAFSIIKFLKRIFIVFGFYKIQKLVMNL